MKKQFVFVCLGALIITSCAVTKTETAKTIDVYGSVVHKPVVADLDIREPKISGSAVFVSGADIENIKTYAVADALKKANADVMVEPRFETITDRGRTTVTVTGWAGNYKNFRQASGADLSLMEAGVMQKAKVYEPVVQQQKSGGKAALWLAVGLLVAGGAAAAALGGSL